MITQTALKSQSEYKPMFADEPTHEPTRGDGYKRTLDYREWRNRVAASLHEAGLEADAPSFLHCAELPFFIIPSDTNTLPSSASTVWVCDHDNAHDAMVYCATCDNRGCPDCAHRQVARFAKRYVPVVLACAEKRGHDRLRKITLTTPLDLRDPDCAEKLRGYCNALGLLWKYLEKQNDKWTTTGTLEAFEFGPNGLKLHFHIYHYGRYLPKNEISKGWKHLTGGEAYIVDVQSVAQDEDATDEEIANEVLETLKYSVKFWSKDRDGNISFIDPELMPALIGVLKGKRRVRSRGCFYNIPAVPKEPPCCHQCSNEMLRVGVVFFPIWQATGFTPQEYRELVEGKRLDLILANKSVLEGDLANKSPPAQRSLWPETDVPGHHGLPRYEEAKNRKAF